MTVLGVKKHLIKTNMTQTQLAKKMGISQPFISDIVNNQRKLTVNGALKFAPPLKVSPLQLLAEQRCNTPHRVDRELVAEVIDAMAEADDADRVLNRLLKNAPKALVANFISELRMFMEQVQNATPYDEIPDPPPVVMTPDQQERQRIRRNRAAEKERQRQNTDQQPDYGIPDPPPVVLRDRDEKEDDR